MLIVGTPPYNFGKKNHVGEIKGLERKWSEIADSSSQYGFPKIRGTFFRGHHDKETIVFWVHIGVSLSGETTVSEG